MSETKDETTTIEEHTKETQMKSKTNTQLYDKDGNWAGFFVSEAAGNAWVKKNPDYYLSDVRPVQAERVSDMGAVTESQEGEAGALAGTS